MSLRIKYHTHKEKKEKTGCTQHYCTYQEKKFHKAAINKENIRVLRKCSFKVYRDRLFYGKAFHIERFMLGN